MKINDFLSPELVIARLRSETKDELFEEMIQLLVDAGKIKDRAAALEAILIREAKLSTGVNHGLAIPHTAVPEVKGLVMALGVSQAGIDYDSLDGKPVHLVVMILSEPGNPGPVIQALAAVCRVFSKPSVRESLLAAQSAAEVLTLIRQEE
jgi:mannitol/fructose-specific phosphotransferase system IIA component (Ntr-type)